MEDTNNSQLPPIQTLTEPKLPPLLPQSQIQITQPVNIPLTPSLTSKPSNQNEKKTGIGFYIISIIIILFLISACYVLAFRSKDIFNLITKKNTNLSSSQKTSSDKSISKNSPLKSFVLNFSTNNYKIATTGKIKITGPIEGKNSNWSINYSLDKKDFFTNNGNLLRLNFSETTNYIKKDYLYYIINPIEKTYKQLDLEKQANLIKTVYTDNFLLTVLLNADQAGNLTWTDIGNNQWAGIWKLKIIDVSNPVIIKVKISINSNTNLIDTISLKKEESDPWQDINFEYEQVADIEEFLVIPADYKK